MPQYASWADVNAAYEGDLDEGSKIWVETQIGRAERLLLSRRRSIPGRVEAGTLARQNVTDAIVNAVLRVVRNPEGLEREQEGTYGYGQHRDVAAGKLFYTGDDYALVDQVPASAAPSSIPIGLPAHRRPHLGGS